MVRLGKVVARARSVRRSSIGFSLDGADNMNVFIAFVPGTNEIWDMPILEKSAIAPTSGAEDVGEMNATISGAVDSLLSMAADRALAKPVRTKRGLRSLELVHMIDQQYELLFKCNLHACGALNKWMLNAGTPDVDSCASPVRGDSPNMISLVSDQGFDIVFAVQALKWAGVRCVWIPDHNHRDDNDAKASGASVRIPIEMIGKCAVGPFGMGLWHKSVLEVASRLLGAEEVLEG